jgi:hypothetical protein
LVQAGKKEAGQLKEWCAACPLEQDGQCVMECTGGYVDDKAGKCVSPAEFDDE